MAAAIPQYETWLSSETIEGLSDAFQEPTIHRERRAEAFRQFLRLPLEPNPLYRKYGYFSGVDLSGLDPHATGAPVPLPRPLPGSIRVVHDASGSQVQVDPLLAQGGVRLEPFGTIAAGSAEEAGDFLPPSAESTDRLSALGFALLNRGYRLSVPDGFRTPVRVQDITVLSRPHEALSVRRVIRAGSATQILWTEELFSTTAAPPEQRLYASATDLTAGRDAKIVALSVHAPDLKTVSVYQRTATVGPAGGVVWVWSGFGGFRTKVRNLTSLSGTGSTVEDLQSFYGAQDQAYDSSVQINHLGTDTHGQSVTRGVFTDDARGMSRGLVRIEPEARRTISYISEHAMLLSKGARSDTLPILEILCRDVKATHSTSVAPVDPEKVFYLASRGLDETSAIKMIGEGFLSHVLDRTPIAGLRDTLYPHLEARWTGQPILWDAKAFPTLPDLTVSGSATSPDWRFDAKLR